MKAKYFFSLCSICILLLFPQVVMAQPVSLGTPCSCCGKEMSRCMYKGKHPKCRTCGKVCGARNGGCACEGVHSRPRARCSGMHAGHEWVDLGLSVKWATCNIGASSPTDFGNYYAWGETSPKSDYAESNSKTYGRNMIDIGGNPRCDAARANWGGSWRLPTYAECEELLSNCYSEWTTQNGVAGRRFTSTKNGSSIFIPAAGYRAGTSAELVGRHARYWSSTPIEGETETSLSLEFPEGDIIPEIAYFHCRFYGYTIRPVLK